MPHEQFDDMQCHTLLGEASVIAASIGRKRGKIVKMKRMLLL